MKKILGLNFLILITILPYVLIRWIQLPYVPPTDYLEDIIGFGAVLVAPSMLVNTIFMMIFHQKSGYWKEKSIGVNIFLLSVLLLFSIYAGVRTVWHGDAVWLDSIALFVYTIAFRYNRLEVEKDSI